MPREISGGIALRGSADEHPLSSSMIPYQIVNSVIERRSVWAVLCWRLGGTLGVSAQNRWRINRD